MNSDRDPAPALPAERRERGWRRVLLCIIAFAAAFWLLRETYDVMMPVLFALFLALGLWPMVHSVRERMPAPLKWLGPAAALLASLVILAVFLLGLGLAARQVFELGSNLAPDLQQRLGELPLLEDWLSEGGADGESLTGGGSVGSTALAALGMTFRTLGAIVVILFLMLLMLTEARSWHLKINALARRDGDERWLEIGRTVGQKFRAYFTTRLILGLITAALYVGWLAIFGVDYLFLWGVLAVLLNFVPTVGSIIAGLLPTAYALLTRDLAAAAIIAGGLLVIEQVMGNFVDPKIMGRRLAISPLVVLISLLFWSLLWGVAGALLSVPLTVLVTMVMAHFQSLKPGALLMTDCTTMEELEDYSKPG